MVSAFQSREFGFGFRALTSDELRKINQTRQGKEYTDKEAAIRLGCEDGIKRLMDKHPFVLEFGYGASSQGYWSHEHTIIQVEDVMDVLKILYPAINFVLLFDNSYGHNR